MILRPFDPAAGDATRLDQFRCSTGQAYEDDVEAWVRTHAIAWANDIPRATFQRRVLALLEGDDEIVAVVAWQDITKVDLDGIWLEVLAVSLEHQNAGQGRAAYELTIEHLRAIDRDGNHLAGLVHVDNERSKRLLNGVGWSSVTFGVTLWGDHELWIGAL